MESTRRLSYVVGAALLIFSTACAGPAVSTTPTAVVTSVSSPTPTPEPMSSPTPTPSPTSTPVPAATATPVPTPTPRPRVLFDYLRGIHLMDAGQYEDAAQMFSVVLDALPEFSLAYYRRGASYLRLDSPAMDLALSDLDRAIDLDPELADAYRDRGILFALQGQQEMALADLDTAIELYQGAEKESEAASTRTLMQAVEAGVIGSGG